MQYRHQILLVTAPIEGGEVATTVLKERVTEDQDPPRPVVSWPDFATTRTALSRPVVCRMILGKSYLSWMHKHPRAKVLSEGQQFASLQAASNHLGIGPTRLSTAFSISRARGEKFTQLPKGVVWGYVEEPEAVPNPDAGAQEA